MISKKKLSGGLALASLAIGGCGDSPEERFDDAARDLCRHYADCDGYGTAAYVSECVDEVKEEASMLSDDCLEAYAIVLECYVDASGPSCRELSDAELLAECSSEFERAVDLCPALVDDL